MTEWQPIETAPKDTPILGMCNDGCSAPACNEKEHTLCMYHAFAEGLGVCGPGMHIIEFGGGFFDGWEDGGGCMPDWWFRAGSEFEEVANPTHWMPLPEPPAP